MNKQQTPFGNTVSVFANNEDNVAKVLTFSNDGKEFSVLVPAGKKIDLLGISQQEEFLKSGEQNITDKVSTEAAIKTVCLKVAKGLEHILVDIHVDLDFKEIKDGNSRLRQVNSVALDIEMMYNDDRLMITLPVSAKVNLDTGTLDIPTSQARIVSPDSGVYTAELAGCVVLFSRDKY